METLHYSCHKIQIRKAGDHAFKKARMQEGNEMNRISTNNQDNAEESDKNEIAGKQESAQDAGSLTNGDKSKNCILVTSVSQRCSHAQKEQPSQNEQEVTQDHARNQEITEGRQVQARQTFQREKSRE